MFLSPNFKWWNVKNLQKQSSRGVLRKRCSENMRQIYKRTPMSKCHFKKVVFLVFSEHLFLRTCLGGCFWTWNKKTYLKCKHQPKQMTISREKIWQLRKSALFEKCVWSCFEILNSTFCVKQHIRWWKK